MLERALIWNGVRCTEHTTIKSLLTINHIVKFQDSKDIFTSWEKGIVWCSINVHVSKMIVPFTVPSETLLGC